LHWDFGDYENEGKSMKDIVLEKYGEQGLAVLEKLL
jgi:hypothetical protein